MYRDDDLALLNRPLYAFLTVAPRDGRWPAPRPVWFEVTGGGDLQMFTLPSSPKVARLEATPRASVVVAAPTGEPEHWVSAEGPATLHSDGAVELALRLAERYWDEIDPVRQQYIDEWRTVGLLRIVVRPEVVNRYAA